MTHASDSSPSEGSEVPTFARSTPSQALTPGQLLGERYQIRANLGSGGMGEVWQAFDLKLRVEVALKSLRPELIGNERGLELLRGEVRSAREVISPNVCRIFDLVVEDGRELVSMEYIDGITLLELLRTKGPLPMKEAVEIAAQFLAGLDAIHRAGLVHRDLKPENLMITRAGRVVVMDFGIAEPATESGSHTVSGTPAYMAPEQLRGEPVDARADVFSAGVVLAEMVSDEGIQEHASRETLWSGIRMEPPRVPECPWSPVLRKAVATRRDERYPSAQALVRALEEVTLRAGAYEDKSPYPGLATFTESEAEYFYGREAEVEAVWKRLANAHLLAIIGPSGAGKSSFLRAGLLAASPEGWGYVICHPGNAPFASVARELVPELSGDVEAVRELVRFDDLEASLFALRRWRGRHSEALVVVDQFEELFTQNGPTLPHAAVRRVSRTASRTDQRAYR